MGGDLIREARRRAGLTQRELATRADTTQSAVARWETGGVDPGFDTVRRMLRLCGFSLTVALDPWDDSDLTQARRQLRLSPQHRVDRMVDSANALAAIRGSLAEARVG